MAGRRKIGRASCRERGQIREAAVLFKKKRTAANRVRGCQNTVYLAAVSPSRTGGSRRGPASNSPVFFFSSRRRHTRWTGDWSSDVCSSDLQYENSSNGDFLLDKHPSIDGVWLAGGRSEERRVGKEGRSGRPRSYSKKKGPQPTGSAGARTPSTWPRYPRRERADQGGGRPPTLQFFFFQAEDGIRDGRVTGVQTCALPISSMKTAATAISCWTSTPRSTAYGWPE